MKSILINVHRSREGYHVITFVKPERYVGTRRKIRNTVALTRQACVRTLQDAIAGHLLTHGADITSLEIHYRARGKP